MSQSLSKAQRKLVSQGSSTAGRRIREAGRASRMIAVPAAIAVAKADAVAGAMVPTFQLPVLGATRATTLGGYVLAGLYMFAKNPSTLTTIAGLSGIGLAARGQKA